MKHCENCGKELNGLYCAHCGQKVNLERITLNYLWNEIFHFFTHIEKGFLFTSLQMLVKPGKTVRNFIDGKRRDYQSPISYFVIWATIFILFLYLITKVFGENVIIDYKEYFGPGATTKFAISHLSMVLAVIMPFHALYLYLLVTEEVYNYFETMVATIYSLGTIILLQFAFAVAALLIHLISSVPVDLRISDSLKVFYLTWFIFDFVKLFPVKKKFLRALAWIILSFGTFTLWRLYGLPALINWAVFEK